MSEQSFMSLKKTCSVLSGQCRGICHIRKTQNLEFLIGKLAGTTLLYSISHRVVRTATGLVTKPLWPSQCSIFLF